MAKKATPHTPRKYKGETYATNKIFTKESR